MDEAQGDMLQQLLAITGSDNPTVAHNLLEATNWSLEDAVNLHFASGGADAAPSAAHAPAAVPLAAGGAGLGGAGAAGFGDAELPGPLGDLEEVRAPMPTKRERLYGDHMSHIPKGATAGPSNGFGMSGARRADSGPGYVDAFRDFKAEGEGTSGAGLSDLFKPPEGLAFKGGFDAAKEHASKQGKWLLVNVQSGTEFASHQLNRDTWSHALVQDMVKGMFVFWQVYETVGEGQRISQLYALNEFPTTIIVDPITGAKLWERGGFIGPDTLCEQLVPYMDHSPNDPDAWKLAQSTVSKRKAAAPLQPPRQSGPAARGAALSEEEQLEMAIRMSMQQAAGAGTDCEQHGGSGDEEAEEEDSDAEEEAAIYRELERRRAAEEAAASTARPAGSAAAAPSAQLAQAAVTAPAPAMPQVDPEQAQAEAAARLPPEPTGSDSCRVAIRLPDGSRVQRSFARSSAVQVLRDFCIAKSAEAAAGRRFQLAVPGAGGTALSDDAQTLEEAGVANTMLVMAWSSS